MWVLVHSRQIRRVVGAYTLNRIGSWVGLVALSLAVFDQSRGSSAVVGRQTGAVVGLLLAWQALPAFISPWVVVRVEKAQTRFGLSGLYLFEGVVTAAIVLAIHVYWLVLPLALLDGTAALAASSLLRSEAGHLAREMAGNISTEGFDPSGVDARHQVSERDVNAAIGFGLSASFIAGPVLGGVLTAGLGAPAALLLDVASFLLCGVLLLDLRPYEQEAAAVESARARLLGAWEHVRGTRLLRGVLLVQAFGLLFVQAAGPLEVSLVKATLHGGDRGYGLMVSAWGAGAVLGSIAFQRFSRASLGTLLAAGTLALGVAFLGYALAPSLALACAAAAVGGVGNSVQLPALMSLVQQLTPPDLHGRVLGGVESLTAMCLAGGLALGGALVALAGARSAFLVLGLGTCAAAAGLVRLTRRGPGEIAAAATTSADIVAPA